MRRKHGRNRAMRRLWEDGLSHRELGRLFGVSTARAGEIVRRERPTTAKERMGMENWDPREAQPELAPSVGNVELEVIDVCPECEGRMVREEDQDEVRMRCPACKIGLVWDAEELREREREAMGGSWNCPGCGAEFGGREEDIPTVIWICPECGLRVHRGE